MQEVNMLNIERYSALWWSYYCSESSVWNREAISQTEWFM